MGSDLFDVSLTNHVELSRVQAYERCLLRGYSPWQLNLFFERDDAQQWLELALEVKTIHPDADLGWDPTFLMRIIDSGVVDAELWRDKPKHEQAFGFKDSPFSVYNGGYDVFLGMDFWTNKNIIWVDHIQYTPPAKHDWDDRCSYVVILPKYLAPNLAEVKTWASRAWPGKLAQFHHDDVNNRQRRCVETRNIYPTMIMEKGKVTKFENGQAVPCSIKWPKRKVDTWLRSPQGEDLFVCGRAVYRLLDDYAHEEVSFANATGKIKTLFFNDDGSVWLAMSKELLLWKDGELLETHNRANGFLSNKVLSFHKRSDGSLIAYGDRGLSIHQADGTWLDITNKQWITSGSTSAIVDAQDRLWTYAWSRSGINTLYLSPGNEVVKDQSIEDYLLASASQRDGAFVQVVSQKIFYVPPDHNTVEHLALLNVFFEKNMYNIDVIEQTMWIAFQDSSIAALQPGQPVRLFTDARLAEHPELAEQVTDQYVLSNGDLCVLFKNKLHIYDLSQLMATVHREPDNAPFVDLTDVCIVPELEL